MTGEAASAEQLTGRATMLLFNRDHRDPTKHVVNDCVCGGAAKDSSKSRCGGNDPATPLADRLE